MYKLLKRAIMEEKKEEIVEEKAENVPEPDAAPQEELSREEQLLALAEDFKRKWYAVSAEYDNYRKRNAQAVSKAYEEGVAEAVLNLLPVADNFGYALDGAADEKT